MANKQAKLSLGLDLRAFNQSIKDAKRSLKDLEDSVGAATGEGPHFNRGGGLGRWFGGGGGRGFGGNNTPRLPTGISSPINAAAGVFSSPLGILGAVGLGAVAAGIGAAFSRQLEQSRVGIALRSLSGNAIVRGYGDQGFNLRERYERGLQIAGAAGRDLTDEGLTKFVDSSEKLQRAFGISGEQYAGAMGAARKAGISDQDKFISGVIGDAVADKMSGSAVGEYLAQMTGYMESMAKGVEIDDKSLRGMAGALGNMEFFKRDPAKIFDALRGIEGAFRDNDPYMQYLSYRSIQDASKKAISPAGVEIRREMGLFGNKIGDKEMEEMRQLMPGLADVYDIGGKKTIESRGKFAFGQFLGKGKRTAEEDQIAARGFAGAMGLTVVQARPIMMEMLKWVKSGKKIEDWQMTQGTEKAYKEGLKTPEQRAADVMKTFEADMVKLDQELNKLMDAMSRFTMEGVNEFVKAVKALTKLSPANWFGKDGKTTTLQDSIFGEMFGGRDVGGDGKIDMKQVRGGINFDRVTNWIHSLFAEEDPWDKAKNESSNVVSITPHQEKKKAQEETKAAQESVRSSTLNNAPEDPDLKALKDNTVALDRLTRAIYGIRLVAAGGRP